MKSLQAYSIIAGAVCVALIDGWVKFLAISQFAGLKHVAGGFGLTLHKNPGIAFDIPIPIWIIAPITLVIGLWLVAFAKRHWLADQKPAALAAMSIIIGASGNLLDRLINGFTTDYILLFGVTVINLADILIVVGISMLLWYTRDKKAH